MMATTNAPVAVRWNEDEGLDTRTRDGVADDLGSQLGQPAKAALLPRGDQRGDRALVGDRGPSGGEREPAARALPAP